MKLSLTGETSVSASECASRIRQESLAGVSITTNS